MHKKLDSNGSVGLATNEKNMRIRWIHVEQGIDTNCLAFLPSTGKIFS